MGRPDDEINRILIAALIGLVLCLVAAAVLAQPAAPDAFDAQRALETSRAAVGRNLPAYTLRDDGDRPLATIAFRGKPLLISFVYTGCFSACPAATRALAENVARAQRVLGAGTFNVMTVGFNQPFDSPAAMREFRHRHGLGSVNWVFASADAQTIAALASSVGFTWSSNAGGLDHVTQLTVVDPEGRIADQVYGESFEPARIVDPLRAMLAGAPPRLSDVGGLLERVRILCTVYDARQGRYRVDYALVIELFAGLSVLLAIVFYLLREWRGQRRARRVTAGEPA